jgi:hypothetical protein
MAQLSRKSRGRKSRGRKPPQPADEFARLLAQLPADSVDRKILTEFSSKTGELFANFEAEFAGDKLAGREPDPRKAMEMAISNFEITRKAALHTVHDLETARNLERDLDAAVEGILEWFHQWAGIATPGSAKAKEVWEELNKQLHKISSDAKADAWRSLRAVPDATDLRTEDSSIGQQYPNPATPEQAAVGETPRPLRAGTAELIALMSRIEEWRLTAGPDGGKLKQADVARMMNIDLRAYADAKIGKPRGKDHLGRIRKFAADKQITSPDSAK